MQREKNKNRIKSGGSDEGRGGESEESTNPASVEPVTEPRDPNAPLIDEDGQSHNIDNAEQLAPNANSERERETYYETVTKSTDDSFPTIIIASEASDEERALPMDALPPPPRVEVESEQLEVIEIKSDGSTGHLTPLQHRAR